MSILVIGDRGRKGRPRKVGAGLQTGRYGVDLATMLVDGQQHTHRESNEKRPLPQRLNGIHQSVNLSEVRRLMGNQVGSAFYHAVGEESESSRALQSVQVAPISPNKRAAKTLFDFFRAVGTIWHWQWGHTHGVLDDAFLLGKRAAMTTFSHTL
jgi:hypothetical protein